MSIALPHTLNCSDGKGNFPPPIDVGVEYSQDVLNFSGITRDMAAAPEAACRPPVEEET